MIYEVEVTKESIDSDETFTYLVEVESYNEIEKKIKKMGIHKTDEISRVAKVSLDKPYRIN